MTAKELLGKAAALLLDFDGPICSVFAGVPAVSVADQLRSALVDGGYPDLPDAVAESADPFNVLQYAVTLGEDEAQDVEAAFTAHEVEAVTSAIPTPGAHELMAKWHESGRSLAVVSNNSDSAIDVYLRLYDLSAFVDWVSARSSSGASRLKPNPYLVVQAVAALGVCPEEAVFLGDSPSDIDAAHAAGVHSIGYANKPGKDFKLASASADAIVETLADLAPVP